MGEEAEITETLSFGGENAAAMGAVAVELDAMDSGEQRN